MIAAQEGHVQVCTLLFENGSDIDQQRNNGTTPLMIASSFGHIEVCKFLLKNGAIIDLKDGDGENALFYAVRQKKYDICKLLIQHGIDMNIVSKDGKSILETAYTVYDKTILSLIKEHQTPKTVNEEIEETKKHLKKLQIMQIINTKRETLAETENAKAKLDELNQLVQQKQEERGNLEARLNFLIQDDISTIKYSSGLATEDNQMKLLLQQKKKAECQSSVNNMLDKISEISQSINKYVIEIKKIEVMTADYERQKRECEFYDKVFHEGKYDEIIKELNKECPICCEEMLAPLKIFQCSQGHLLCENCFKKITVSTKVCPFCKRDVVSIPIRNRALEDAIENEVKKDMGVESQN